MLWKERRKDGRKEGRILRGRKEGYERKVPEGKEGHLEDGRKVTKERFWKGRKNPWRKK